MIFEITNLTDDLAPGKYSTRIIKTKWTPNGPLVVLEITHPWDEDNRENNGVFPLTKE